MINISLSFGFTQVVDGTRETTECLYRLVAQSKLRAIIPTFLDFNYPDDTSVFEVLSEGFRIILHTQ